MSIFVIPIYATVNSPFSLELLCLYVHLKHLKDDIFHLETFIDKCPQPIHSTTKNIKKECIL